MKRSQSLDQTPVEPQLTGVTFVLSPKQQIFRLWGYFSKRITDRRLRGPFLYTSSSLVRTITIAITGLVVARLVLPEEIGTWQSVSIILPYIMLLSLGLPDASGRQFAYLLGAGDSEQAQEFANVGFAYTLLWSTAGLLITMVIMFLTWWRGADYKTMLAFLLFIPVAGSYPLSQFLHSLYRNGQEFGTLGIVQFIEIIYNIISVLFVYFWGWSGLFIRYSTIVLITAILRYAFCPVSLRIQFSWPLFRLLFKMGLPRLAITIINNLFLAVDSTLIVTQLGKEAMGFYALALLAERAISVIPLSLTHIVQTNLTIRYGRTKTAHSLWRVTFLPVLAIGVVLIIPAILAVFLIGPFVNAFLPNYKPGIDAAQLTIIGGYFSALQISRGIFGAVDKLFGYTLFMLGSLGLFYLLGYIGLQWLGTVQSVAAAKLMTMIFMAIGINLMAAYHIRTADSSTRRQVDMLP